MKPNLTTAKRYLSVVIRTLLSCVEFLNPSRRSDCGTSIDVNQHFKCILYGDDGNDFAMLPIGNIPQ
ncbi:MAG: hypothetical protein J0G95_12540 [Rhizobiales bacterium]|nr:hypothetical protein [Hyphomicrobiales bacterium]